MITVTFSGETLVDVAEQAKSFADETLGVEVRDMSSLVNNSLGTGAVPLGNSAGPMQGYNAPAEKPARKPRAPKAPAENLSEKAPTRPAELGQEIDAGAPDPEADLAKVKEEALDVLRTVFGKGEAGQKKVREILKDKKFAVKKAGDVPVEKAHDLMFAASKALAALNDDAA